MHEGTLAFEEAVTWRQKYRLLSLLTLQVWMCGGRMEDIPCSRVGHIYRKYVPYKVPAGVSLARVRWWLP